MNLTRPFVELLRQKLTVSSTRSILLNALPGRLISRLPLSDLANIKKQLPASFLELLTAKNGFQFKFAIDPEGHDENTAKKLVATGRRIAAIKYDHDDYFKEHGVETFGFGFPLLLRKTVRDPEKYIAAPVFIFPLSVKQSFDQDKEWIISRAADAEIRLNEVLLSYLESEEHLKLPQLPEEMLEDGLLDKQEMELYCRELMTRFNMADASVPQWDNPEPVPDKISREDPALGKTRILWNGVFGIYKGQKQSLINEMDLLLSGFDTIMTGETGMPAWEQPHSPMVTDPSQNGVLRSLKQYKDLVIQGPPGTGKSQTLTAIIASALANKKKVLVVCEKRTALDVLKNNLQQLIPETAAGIGLIEDVSRDRTAIVDMVRNRTATAPVVQEMLDTALIEKVTRFETKSALVQSQYEALTKLVWQQYTRPDIVGQWLAAAKTSGEVDELYHLQKDFPLQGIDDTSFPALMTAVDEGALLFRKVREAYPALEQNIKARPSYDVRAERELIHALKQHSANLDRISTQLQEAGVLYKQCLITDRIKALEQGEKKILLLQEYINEGRASGQDPFAPSLMTRIKALFSDKYKRILERASESESLYRQVGGFWNQHFKESVPLEALPDKLVFLRAHKSGKALQDVEALRLTLYPDIPAGPDTFDRQVWVDIKREISGTTDALSSLVQLEKNGREHLSLGEILSLLDRYALRIRELLALESSIRDYFTWKSYLLSLKPGLQYWLGLLLEKEEPECWKPVLLQAWIYYKLITGDERDKYPADDTQLQLLKELGSDIQLQQKDKIKANLNDWFKDGQQKIRDKGIQLNQLYNLRGAKGSKRNSLRTIVHTRPDAFTDFFPVLMLNPSTCSSLLPLQRDTFDLVIFDEASQLRIQDTFGALLRGRQVVVSGDSQQMPPSGYFEASVQLVDGQEEEEEMPAEEETEINTRLINDSSKGMAFKESLLEFSIDMGFRETYLDMHYRSRHPDLIAFSNVCFYNSRLIAMPEQTDDLPIRYTFVNGVYENRQNEAEAQEVIRVLKEEIDPVKSVGVATFNLQQRNLILNRIHQEGVKDKAFRQKMDLFEQHGFFVKNLENIQGDEKDVILLSTTFGTTPEGKFALRFGPVGQKNGHRLLNVILTRAKHKLYVLTSIPETRAGEYRIRLEAHGKVDGTTGLLAYLVYAKMVSNGDHEGKKGVLDFIRSAISADTAITAAAFRTTSFQEEVRKKLERHIGTSRITLRDTCGGFTIGMVVRPAQATGPKLAIECDGAAYREGQLAWHYDLYRQEQLEQNGFIVHRVWSANWWRNPEEELDRLLKVIAQIH